MVFWVLLNFKQVFKLFCIDVDNMVLILILKAGEYMIVITGCQRIGTLMQGCDVLRATTFQILPIARNTSNLSSQQLDDEQKYVQLLEDHLRSNGFYFSYRYNITLSIQKQAYLPGKGQDNNWRDVCYALLNDNQSVINPTTL